MRDCRGFGLILVIGLGGLAACRADSREDLLKAASEAWRKGKSAEALALASRAVDADPKSLGARRVRATIFAHLGRHEDAIADWDAILRADPKDVGALDQRGSEYFKIGQFKKSIADFDRYLALKPEDEPGHWRRGLSYYYAGEFAKGEKQFFDGRIVFGDDVENAVWHFLCKARREGVEAARKAILPVGKDTRVPLMEVYELFRGQKSAADVLAAAKNGQPAEPELRQRLFYAYLYLGLFHDAIGDAKAALDELILAADKYPIDHYMADVARVHRDRLRQAGPTPKP